MKTLTIAVLTLATITAASAQNQTTFAMPTAGPLARPPPTVTAPQHSVMAWPDHRHGHYRRQRYDDVP
jgi:hypothetical protein